MSFSSIYYFDLRVKSACICEITQEVEKLLLLGTKAFTVNCSRCFCNFIPSSRLSPALEWVEITVDRRSGKSKGFDIEQRS